MLWAFIDESYRRDEGYIVGAIVVSRHQLDNITTSLDHIARTNHEIYPEIPHGIEFHGQQLFQRSEDWACLRLPNGQDRPRLGYSIYRRAVGAVVNSTAPWFIAGVHRPGRIPERYPRDPWSPHSIALHYVLERVNEYAETQNERVKVVADVVANQQLHEAHVELFSTGGRRLGRVPRRLDLIEPGFDWVDSRLHRPLQAIDLLTYIYLRRRWGRDQMHPRAQAELQRLRDTAAPTLLREYIWQP